MKKKVRRLTFSRETLRNLNEPVLQKAPGGGVVVVGDTQQPECYSPLCGPTFWKTCETNPALNNA